MVPPWQAPGIALPGRNSTPYSGVRHLVISSQGVGNFQSPQLGNLPSAVTEVQRKAGRIIIRHQGSVVAEHTELLERHQVRLLPEHGPGAIARNPRQPRLRQVERPRRPWADDLAVEVRELAVYDVWAAQAGGRP